MRSLSILATSIILASLACCGERAPASDKYTDPAFDLLVGADTYRSSKDATACERVLYSKLSDQWLDAYRTGRSSDAEKVWGQILSELKACRSISILIEKLYYRIRFQAEGNEGNESRFGFATYYKSLIAATEKSVGKDHRFVADILGYLGNHYDNTKDFQAALTCRQRRLDILEKLPNLQDPTLASALLETAFDLCKLHNYIKAEVYLKRALLVAEKLPEHTPLRRTVALYGKLLANTGRGTQKQQLISKYQARLSK